MQLLQYIALYCTKLYNTAGEAVRTFFQALCVTGGGVPDHPCTANSKNYHNSPNCHIRQCAQLPPMCAGRGRPKEKRKKAEKRMAAEETSETVSPVAFS